MTTNESMSSSMSGGKDSSVKGTTTIADSVVSTIAGIAAREAPGVYAMGGGVSRTIGAMRDRMSSSDDPSRGVKVEVGQKQAAVDLGIVVEYGSPIGDTAKDIRANVSDTVESMTGLEIAEVNVSVLDVHIPGSDDNDDSSDGSRVE
ncbi:Asp23/Gls24 family envelope stress response protein [Streptomyces sp. NPDC088725]|uniref:Asp23/Gls24 family envelope stress response protein n=1 Tax=Streptomyces sp. NPDC088725 TaxID=3365873 RepID=UPI0037FC2E96